MNNLGIPEKQALNKERLEVLQQLENWLEKPMLVLSFAWLGLFVIDVVRGLSPLLQVISNVIWIIFIVDFTIRFILAPRKLAYLTSNWLTTIALLLPALRVFRIVRFIRLLGTTRVARSLQLVRVITRTNRGMRALSKSFQLCRGFGYVVALTLLITLVGSAGIYVFEKNPDGQGLNNYGSLVVDCHDYDNDGFRLLPQNCPGRVLCFILAVYAFAVFGYVTAAMPQGGLPVRVRYIFC